MKQEGDLFGLQEDEGGDDARVPSAERVRTTETAVAQTRCLLYYIEQSRFEDLVDLCEDKGFSDDEASG